MKLDLIFGLVPCLMLILLASTAFSSPVGEKAGYDEENDEIVGGTAASIKNFPSLGFISLNRKFQCGGTLYKAKYVITAAHCLYGVSGGIEVTFNSTSLTRLDSGAIKRSGVKHKIHEKYDRSTYKNDIAVISLNSAVTTLRSTTICTATAGAAATIVGWGADKYLGPSSDTLKQTTVNVIANAVCAPKYASTPYQPIVSTQLCAAAPGKDTCQGDSGGPIYIGSAQVGVTSFGEGCADSRYPGVYTRLSDFKSWLDATISQL